MSLFFSDPNDPPLPPQEVRIRRLSAEPWHDRRRVRVDLEVTPFQKRPHGEIRITNARGEEVASLSIIGAMMPKMSFTVHLREKDPSGVYTVHASLYYFEEPEESSAPSSEIEAMLRQRQPRVVSTQVASFAMSDA